MPITTNGLDLVAPEITDQRVLWRLPRDLAPDGIAFEVDWTVGQDLTFAAEDDSWTYNLPRPAAERLEYRLDLRGGSGLGLDPTNPRVVPNPFGDRSEVCFPDYREPEWVSFGDTGIVTTLGLNRGSLDAPIPARLWCPADLGADSRAALLIAHDGSGMAESGSLLRWASAHSAQQPMRVLLLDALPGLRNDWYAADPDYLDTLSSVVLPTVRNQVSVSTVVGLGASLGALAMLAWHHRDPAALDGLALQSGSFFTGELDPQESGFPHFDQICAAVEEITAGPPARGVPTLMTCGAIEENYGNNVFVAERLAALHYPLRLVTSPDAHTMIGWRNCWAPDLDDLLTELG